LKRAEAFLFAKGDNVMQLPASFSFLRQGKVRDVYEAGDRRHLLIVASDRISAFDHVLPNPIPGKGKILTRLSNFWFDRTKDLVGNHKFGTSACGFMPLPPNSPKSKGSLSLTPNLNSAL